MDINDHLKATLDLARQTIATSTEETPIRLADYVLEMHDWLSKEGAYPLAWVKHPRENMSRTESRSGL